MIGDRITTDAKRARLGAGRRGATWREWLPSAVLRVAFAKAEGLREAARKNRSNHRHVAAIRACVANLYCEGQREQLARVLTLDKAWQVFQLQWDETSVVVSLGANCSPESVCNIHGAILWGERDGAVNKEEIIMAPCVLARQTAACIVAALLARCPLALDSICDSGCRTCVQLIGDSVSANRLAMRHLQNILPASCPILVSFCLQHQAALALRRTTTSMGFVGSLYSTVMILHSGTHLRALEISVGQLLDQKLEVLVGVEPRGEDVARFDALLEACYTDAAEAKRSLRRKEGDELKVMFSGDIRRARILHHCAGATCCTDRAHSVHRATSAFMAPLNRRLPIPSLNRWLTLQPLICVFLVIMRLHNILARAEAQVVGTVVRAPSAPVEQDPDIQAEHPEDEYRNQQRRRKARMQSFLSHSETVPKLTIWVSLARGVMDLHFVLFKRGALVGRHATDESALFQLCHKPGNPVATAICDLSTCFIAGSAGAAIWKMAVTLMGDPSFWNARLLQLAVTSRNCLLGNLWRRFVVRLRSWPWRLAYIVDTTVPMALRRRRAEAFMSSSDCCLDESFSLRLRRLIASTDELFHPTFQQWLATVFQQGLASTTYIENGFAHMRAFLNRSWRSPAEIRL